jgi:hypothetical protein
MQGKKYIIIYSKWENYFLVNKTLLQKRKHPYGIQEGRLMKFSFYHFNAQIRLELHVWRRKVKAKLLKIEEAHKIEHL